MPVSSLSNPDASELAAFVPFGALAQRATTLASQADSVHTRSSSRVSTAKLHSLQRPQTPHPSLSRILLAQLASFITHERKVGMMLLMLCKVM